MHVPIILRPRRQTSRGVTLLEVIVSMAVLVVGLLGMASLIPLGRLELAEGDRLDNSSTLGRSAFRELSVHGYLNPSLWVHPLTGNPITTDISAAPPYGYIFDKGSISQTAAVLPPNGPIIVDPLMIAPKFLDETPNGPLTQKEQDHRANCLFFPYSLILSDKSSNANKNWPEKSAPRFARATLRAYPAMSALGKSASYTVRNDLASRYFRSTDDLMVDLPQDRARRPVQIFFQSKTTDLQLTPSDGVTTEATLDQVAFRKFRGDYSWFFIVEPSSAEQYSSNALMPLAAGSRGSPFGTHHYRVWVVVCNKRDLRVTTGMSLDQDRAVGERSVWIDFIDRYTARLRISDVADEGTASKILDVKSNQWIAAAGKYDNALGTKQYVLEWFRMVNVADRPQNIENTNIWYREVTLAGREMSNLGSSSLGIQLYDENTFSSYPDMSGVEPLTSWGTIVSGVRGVYEKTIYLDRPSLWASP